MLLGLGGSDNTGNVGRNSHYYSRQGNLPLFIRSCLDTLSFNLLKSFLPEVPPAKSIRDFGTIVPRAFLFGGWVIRDVGVFSSLELSIKYSPKQRRLGRERESL